MHTFLSARRCPGEQCIVFEEHRFYRIVFEKHRFYRITFGGHGFNCCVLGGFACEMRRTSNHILAYLGTIGRRMLIFYRWCVLRSH